MEYGFGVCELLGPEPTNSAFNISVTVRYIYFFDWLRSLLNIGSVWRILLSERKHIANKNEYILRLEQPDEYV